MTRESLIIAGRAEARSIYPGGACERCGADGKCHIHHKDRNPLNNVMSNLVRLCPKCHAQEHAPERKAAIQRWAEAEVLRFQDMARPQVVASSPAPSPDSAPLTIAQVAAELALTPRTVRRHIVGGRLVALRVGRVWRIEQAAFLAFKVKCMGAA